ncbi:MAG: MBL fold metallo-hydrolase [Candidatus Hecatellales archaeon ex4484_218]|nr:MAG: MBL fold metallo-hydrolase [Candidatus Hecatellales archaeon ex4484_218]
MVKEVFPRIFQLKIPLPKNPMNHLNAYLITGKNRVVLVDTGLNSDESFDGLKKELEKVGFKLKDITDVWLTHFHIDHVGLILRLRKNSNFRLIIHKNEAERSKKVLSNLKEFLSSLKFFLKINGAPKNFIKNLDNFYYSFVNPSIYREIANPWLALTGGEKLSLDKYCFKVIWTPGHSAGHVCFYEPNFKFLLSGDHLLPTTTPNVSRFTEDTNPLAEYLDSLEKVEKLDVKKVFPAHEDVFTNYRERIQQLKSHHQQRSKEILEKLQEEKLTAYQLASKIQWETDYESWEKFPFFDKYLAFGEILAHLKLLEEKNLVKKIRKNQVFFYHAKD